MTDLLPWQYVFRLGFAPQMATAALERLVDALRVNSPALLQGATCYPPPNLCNSDWPVQQCCPVSFCGWREGATVSDVSAFFGDACAAADTRLGYDAACRTFLNEWDDTPRERMVPALLAEVERELSARAAVAA